MLEQVERGLPQGRWRTLTFLAALRRDQITAPCVIDGPINGESFLAYVEQVLVPVKNRLRPKTEPSPFFPRKRTLVRYKQAFEIERYFSKAVQHNWLTPVLLTGITRQIFAGGRIE